MILTHYKTNKKEKKQIQLIINSNISNTGYTISNSLLIHTQIKQFSLTIFSIKLKTIR